MYRDRGKPAMSIPWMMKAGQEMRWKLWVKLKRADIEGTLLSTVLLRHEDTLLSAVSNRRSKRGQISAFVKDKRGRVLLAHRGSDMCVVRGSHTK